MTDVPVLALVTYFQYAEGLSDVQAADALRSRLEWKYALHLPVITPVVPETALCRYRQDLFVDPVALREIRKLVQRLAEVQNGQRGESDVLQMLSTICSLNRLVWLYQAMDEALAVLARREPAWLGEVARPYWYTLYRTIAPQAGDWAGKEVTDRLSLTIGADILYLLEKIEAVADSELSSQRAIAVLERMWGEQFERDDAGEIQLRSTCGFCSARIHRQPELD
ncbi:MAG: transposase [Anaerolineae bacterium]|nr:transposase [Anaerolineae bacterium]